jgi:hypothetical protein
MYLNENAVKKIKDEYDKYNTVIGNALDRVPIINNIRGIMLGTKIDAPISGFILGKDGALGAASVDNKNISIGNIYDNYGLLKKMVGGALGGAALNASINGAIGLMYGVPPAYLTPSLLNSAILGAIKGGVTAPIADSMLYGLGKVSRMTYNKLAKNNKTKE